MRAFSVLDIRGGQVCAGHGGSTGEQADGAACSRAQVWEEQMSNHDRHTSYNLIPRSLGAPGCGCQSWGGQ